MPKALAVAAVAWTAAACAIDTAQAQSVADFYRRTDGDNPEGTHHALGRERIACT